MTPKIITDKQDLTYLKWSHARNSSGTAGTFLKSESSLGGHKKYYKLSNYDSEKGIIGHECINEIIVDRLLSLLEIDHLEYQLIHADIELDSKIQEVWLCASDDFKAAGESKASLDDYYQVNKKGNESHYDFCKKQGWQKYIDTMLVVDYLILNRDRHGANIEVLRNARKHSLRIAPLFDHGLSFLYSCYSEEAIDQFDILADLPCNNFIGSRSVYENLKMIDDCQSLFPGTLTADDKDVILQDLKKAISPKLLEKIWSMLWARWNTYEKLCNNR